MVQPIHKFELVLIMNLKLMKSFLKIYKKTIDESIPKVKYVVVNFPHNPSCATVTPGFYTRLVNMAKKIDFI